VFLVSHEAKGAPLEPAVDAAERATAASLLVESLGENRMRELEATLDEVASQLEAKMLGTSLDDADPLAMLQQARPGLLPMYTAAHHFAAGAWESAEHHLRIRPGKSCTEAREGESCLPILGAETSGEPNLVRFFGWSVSKSIVLESTPASVDAVTAALREKTGERTGCIALVVRAPTNVEAMNVSMSRLRTPAARIARVLKRASKPVDPVLSALLERNPTQVPWLSLSPTQILVIPKLGCQAEPARLSEEISQTLSATPNAAETRWKPYISAR
jgi:hypothetical protein